MEKATDAIRKLTEDLNAPLGPKMRIPDFSFMHEAQRRKEKTDAGYASILFDRLMGQVTKFEASLTDEQELGGYLASFGASVLIRVEAITLSLIHI